MPSRPGRCSFLGGSLGCRPEPPERSARRGDRPALLDRGALRTKCKPGATAPATGDPDDRRAAMTRETRYLNPDTLPKPAGYSHVVDAPASARVIHISGQVGLDRDGRLLGQGDFGAQA